MSIELLKGLILKKITGAEVGSQEIIFESNCGRSFKMYHYSDCCESVDLNDICGDINDLIGQIVLHAECVTNCDENEQYHKDYLKETNQSELESFLWTFYKICTIEGCVTLRWLGESNGYYSESVDFEEVSNRHEEMG